MVQICRNLVCFKMYFVIIKLFLSGKQLNSNAQ